MIKENLFFLLGYSKGSVHEIAQNLCAGIGAYAHQNKSKWLKMIRFPVQHGDDLNDFRKVLQELHGTPFKKSRDTFSGRLIEKVGGNILLVLRHPLHCRTYIYNIQVHVLQYKLRMN